jgi:flagellar hook protein FlgE
MSTAAISASISSMSETDKRIEEYSGNIANVGTKGYKGFEAHSQTIVNASGKSAGGVISVTRQLIDHKGGMDKTSFATDLAISGEGFFVVTDKVNENGEIDSMYFTREGSFRRDNLGRLVNSANYLLVGWPLSSDESLPATKSLPSSLSLVDVKQLISEASSTTRISISANLDSNQKVAGGGVATINILNSGLKPSPDNYNISPQDILYPNKANDLTKGDGIKLKSFVANQKDNGEDILVYGGFVESMSFDSAGTELQAGGSKLATDALQFQVEARDSALFQRGTGATNKEVLEHIADQITQNSSGDFSVRARVVTNYVGGVLKSTLLVAPNKANFSITLKGTAAFRQDIGFDDSKNIKSFQKTGTSTVVGRFASLQDLKEHLVTAGLSVDFFGSDGVGTAMTMKSSNPLFIENFRAGNTGSDFLSEFGLTQGFLSTQYDPYDSNNNIAGKKSGFKAHFSQNIEVYDSMGNKHAVIFDFLKLDNQKWGIEVYANDPSKVNVIGRTDGLLQAGIITFDGKGNLQSILETPQISKTKDIASPNTPIGATKGQKFEVVVAAGTSSETKTFNYGAMVASSSQFTPTGTSLVGTGTDNLVLTYKTSIADPGQVFNVARGTGANDLAVLKNIADQINTTAVLRDLVSADVVFIDNKYKINIRPIDSTKILNFSESPATTLGTDLGITSADNIAANSFESLYELAEQINRTEGPFAILADIIAGTTNGTYRLKIQPKTPSLSMTFNGDSQVISAPIGTGVTSTIHDALGLKNTSSTNAVAPLSSEILINWSAIVGAEPNIINVKYGDIGSADGISQVSGSYSIREKEADGWSTGQLNGISVDSDGYIVAAFTNSRTRKIFKLAIADFANRNGLTPLTGNVFAASKDSGPVNLKEAGQDGVGTILSQYLEGSNVDTADQLTKLILAQRQYQASAKVISVVDKLQEDLLHRTFNT